MNPQTPRVWPSLVRAWDGPAVTWTGLLILAPGMLITDALFGGGDIVRGFIIALVAYLAMVCAIWGAHALLLRRIGPGAARWLLVLAVFSIGAFTRIAVISFADPSASSTVVEPWMVTRFFSSLIWLNAAAILVDWQRRDALQLALRNAELARLEQTTAVVDGELARTTSELAAVQRSVIDEIAEVRRELDRPGADLGQVVERLDAAIDDLVRPASHDLAQVDDRGLSTPSVPVHRTGWVEQMRSIVLVWPSAAPFQPAAVTLISAPIAAAAILSRPLGTDSVLEFGLVAAQLAYVAAASVLLTPRLRQMQPLHAVVVVAAAYAGLAIVGDLFALTVAGPGDMAVPEVALLPWVAAVATGGAFALNAHWQSVTAEAEELIGETEWRLNRANQQLWAQRRRLAIILHGRVQASLTSCALLLRLILQKAGPGSYPDELDRVKRSLGQAIDFTDDATGASLLDRLDTLARTWEGVLDVAVTSDADAVGMLVGDPDGTDAIVEAVRELLLNAVRHGEASSLRIDIVRSGPRSVLVDVIEPRRGQESPRIADSDGLGLSLLESVATELVISTTDTARTTRMTFATA